MYFRGINWVLPWDITAYGGTILWGLPGVGARPWPESGVFGATSFDVTQANSSLVDGSKHQGNLIVFFIPNR